MTQPQADARRPRPRGIPCPRCGRPMGVYYTRTLAGEIIRCRQCPKHKNIRTHTSERPL